MTGPSEGQRDRVILVTLTVAVTSYALLQTAVGPTLATFQRELHTNATWATWVVTSFLLSASVATPIIGRLGDQYGKKRLLLISMAILLVGCVGAALAWDIWSLIAFRALQGTAGALFPLGYAIIRDEFARHKVSSGIAVLSAMFGIGGTSGVLGAGLIVDHMSWRWLFIAPAIAVVAGFALTAVLVPESPVKTETAVDVPGAVLFGIGFGGLMLALSEGEHWGWGSLPVVGLFSAGAAMLVLWVRLERRIREPMIDPVLLVRRPMLLLNWAALLTGIAMFAWWVFLPLFVETGRGTPPAAPAPQYGLGYSATEAGLLMLPASMATLLSGVAAGRLGARIGMKRALALGMAVTGAALGALAAWHDTLWQILPEQIWVGAGLGASLAALPALVTEAARQEETGVANGMNVVIRTVGLVLGAQIGAVFIATFTIGRTSVPAEKAFTLTFAIAAGCAVAAALSAARLPRSVELREPHAPLDLVTVTGGGD